MIVGEVIKYFTMKANWLLLLVLLLSANSCKKEVRAEKQIKSQIVAQWELSFYSCGECIIPSTTYPQGNGNTIGFAEDGRFLKKLKDSVTFNGHYDIVTSKVCDKAGNVALQTNESTNGSLRFITLENETLQLSTPGCYTDGAVSIYKRIN
jgi:hypothetical protein